MVLPAAPSKALSLALLAFLLPHCLTLQLNPFDMKVFLTSVAGISGKVNNMESLLVNSSKELVTKFELTRKDLEDKLASADEEFELFQAEALAAISSIQSSVIATRDELAANKRNWDDGLAKISFIESSVNATRNGMDDNRRELANVLASVSSIESSVKAARDELNVNKRDWDTSLALIHSIQSTLSATQDDLASNKKDWNDAIAGMSSMRSSISAAQEELTSTKKEWSNVLGRLPSIESSLSATRTEVAEILRNINRGHQCAFTGSTALSSTPSWQRDIAFGKPTYGSPYFGNLKEYNPSKAVDDDRNSMYHSEILWNPWWLVDFGSQSTIKEIIIQPRFESGIERFHEVEIRLGNDLVQNGDFSSYKLLFFYRGPYTGAEGLLKCSFSENITGRYLSIQIKNKMQYLQINTVKVFA